MDFSDRTGQVPQAPTRASTPSGNTLDHARHRPPNGGRNADNAREPDAEGTITIGGSLSVQGLTDEEQAIIAQLARADAAVRAHERAHRAAGGGLTSPASFTLKPGPDGQLYAVAGEVSIDVGPASSPQATIQKMQAVIRAALAPGDPSAQDRAVAAAAKRTLLQAQRDLQTERAGETAPGSDLPPQSPPSVHAAYQDAENSITGVQAGAVDRAAFVDFSA